MSRPLTLCLLFTGLTRFLAAADVGEGKEYIDDLAQSTATRPVVLVGSEHINTKTKFRPPVAITILAMTDSTNLRLGYAANQVIFNWERRTDELRVDGGPANGRHKKGAGKIPTQQYVTFTWLVTTEKQMIHVDDELRFEHEGDYSHIDKPISIFTKDSKVTVKSIKVKKL